jgi:hypothetical protein
MSTVSAFKALDFDLKTYGFWPPDLVAVLLFFVIVHGIFNSLVLDLVVIGPAFYAAWRGRRRPPVYLRSLFFFSSTAQRFGVGHRKEAISR